MLLKLIAYFVIGLYTLSLAYVTIYCILQFHLLLKYGKGKRNGRKINKDGADILGELPSVTVQLPLYNERFVVERLIDNIVQLDYPANKLQIQVLDDSTD